MKLAAGQRFLILGATSPIARHTARELAKMGCHLCLAGRDMAEVERVASDLRVRFGPDSVSGLARPFDAMEYDSHPALVQDVLPAAGRMEHLDGVFIFFGDGGDSEKARESFQEARRIVEVNFLGAVSVLTPLANYFEGRREGVIVGVSSVAGERGRARNYHYGSAKGALSLFLQGLRNRLARANVQVVTVKPGYVDTAMTYGVVRPSLAASPQSVARGIVRAVEKGRDVVYLPGRWRTIMFVVRLIPERVFKRLDL